jgi:hypothetical protein
LEEVPVLAFSSLAPGPPNRSVLGFFFGISAILLATLVVGVLINVPRLTLFFRVFNRREFGLLSFLVSGLNGHIAS